MEDLTNIPQFVLKLFGFNLVFNVETIIMTWIVMAVLIVFGFLATRKIAFVPNPFQLVGELFVSAFYGLTKDALDEEMAKKYFPLICSLFSGISKAVTRYAFTESARSKLSFRLYCSVPSESVCPFTMISLVLSSLESSAFPTSLRRI